MKFKAFLLPFVAAMQVIQARADAAASVIGPADNYEANPEVKGAKDTLKFVSGEVAAQVAKLESPDLIAAAEKFIQDEVAAALAAKVTAGEFLAKADVDLAIIAAKAEGKKDADAAAKLREDATAKVTARRAEITTAHGAEVAAAIPDNVLMVEDFTVVSAEIGRRVTALEELGVTAAEKPASFADVACGSAFDADGNKAFDTRFAGIKELVGPKKPGATATAAASRGAVKPGSGQPPAAGKKPGEGAAEEDKVVTAAAF